MLPNVARRWLHVRALDHVCVAVSNVDASIEWYGNVLGLRLAHATQPHFYPVDPTCPAFMGIPDHPGTGIALLPSQERLIADHRGAHFALRVSADTFAEAHGGEALKRRLVKFQAHPEQSTDIEFWDYGIQHSLFFCDPDGNVVELTTWAMDQGKL
jgi:catechol 2,3-dioxygenase-like lactoylglutathione lyase family enzyme